MGTWAPPSNLYGGLKVLGRPLGVTSVSPTEAQVLPRGPWDVPRNSPGDPWKVPRMFFRGPRWGLRVGPKFSQNWARQAPKYVHGAMGTYASGTLAVSINTPKLEMEISAIASWTPGRPQAVHRSSPGLWLVRMFRGWVVVGGSHANVITFHEILSAGVSRWLCCAMAVPWPCRAVAVPSPIIACHRNREKPNEIC